MLNEIGIQCPRLSPPNNGALVCDIWLQGSHCKMFCNDQFDVPPGKAPAAQDLFVCGFDDGTWNAHIPDCSGNLLSVTEWLIKRRI